MKCLLFILIFFIALNIFAVKAPVLPTDPLDPNSPEFDIDATENIGSMFGNSYARGSSTKDINLYVNQVRNTISYGLDNQVIEIVKSLKRSRDGEYNSLLEKRLHKTFNIELKGAILDLFLSLKYGGGIDVANSILDTYESKRYPNSLINRAILYLKELGNKDDLKRVLIDILENKEGNIVATAAYYLGEISAIEYSKNMIDIYDKYSGNDMVRAAILVALGKSNAFEYGNKIYEISMDNYENPTIKASAIKALSYLAPEKITENVEFYLQNNNNNSNIKFAIIEALSRDVSLKSKEVLQDFLRDSDETLRIRAVNAIKGHGDISAREALVYKVKSDPSFKVREASGKALVDMGSGYEDIKNIIIEPTVENNFKFTMFNYLLDKNVDFAFLIALELLKKENINKPSKLLSDIAVLLAARKGNFDDFYSKIINSKNIDLRNLAIKGAVYNKSSALENRLKEIKRITTSEYLKKLLKNY
ncbi:HEAT repeat domain-containing protein [Borrelia sp. A-FGy1]|uniref:HEAT repeat domain-containing protein n=1 Tax=Borrelia sp. A-FGy1 TaxID=2608247 RepID=UPI0015F7279F|nr:HEAT repeat domain-containing protein [Borrelia sp. A-FGy1]QMU99553.1 HEAT repeat domain-containing protein [Borrelia sp. A-FGy1]